MAKPMSLRSFMKAVPWETMRITKDGAIRQRRTGCCPILAAVNRRDGSKRRQNVDYVQVAQQLGLDEASAGSIVDAADWPLEMVEAPWRPLRKRFERAIHTAQPPKKAVAR